MWGRPPVAARMMGNHGGLPLQFENYPQQIKAAAFSIFLLLRLYRNVFLRGNKEVFCGSILANVLAAANANPTALCGAG